MPGIAMFAFNSGEGQTFVMGTVFLFVFMAYYMVQGALCAWACAWVFGMSEAHATYIA